MAKFIGITKHLDGCFGFAGIESLIAISATTVIKTTTSKITIHLAFFFFKVLHPLYP